MISILNGRLLFVLAVGLCGASIAIGCSESDEQSGCDAITSRYRSCNLIDSTATFACIEPESAADLCISKCFTSATCAEIHNALCLESRALLEKCNDQCGYATSNETDIDCGDGETYTEWERCDDYEDCSNGADERNCPHFTCKSGEVISLEYRCDGDLDCDDDSDEMGCPTFRCKNGDTIPQDSRCDGFDDCSDESDEWNCPKSLGDVLTCY
jgi:hypothetical protein